MIRFLFTIVFLFTFNGALADNVEIVKHENKDENQESVETQEKKMASDLNCAWLNFSVDEVDDDEDGEDKNEERNEERNEESKPEASKVKKEKILNHVMFGHTETGFKSVNFMSRYGGAVSLENAFAVTEEGKIKLGDLEEATFSEIYKCCSLNEKQMSQVKSGMLNVMNHRCPSNALKSVNDSLSAKGLADACYSNTINWLSSVSGFDKKLEGVTSFEKLYEKISEPSENSVSPSCERVEYETTEDNKSEDEENYEVSGSAGEEGLESENFMGGLLLGLRYGKTLGKLPMNVSEEFIKGIQYPDDDFWHLNVVHADADVQDKTDAFIAEYDKAKERLDNLVVEVELMKDSKIPETIAPYKESLVARKYKVKSIYRVEDNENFLDKTKEERNELAQERKVDSEDSITVQELEFTKYIANQFKIKPNEEIIVYSRAFQKGDRVSSDGKIPKVGDRILIGVVPFLEGMRSTALHTDLEDYDLDVFYSDYIIPANLKDLEAAEKAGFVKYKKIE